MSLPAPSVAFEPIEPGERTRRQVAVRLLPFLFVLYVANYIDRTSVAFAALGISGDLGLSDRTLGLAAGIFFVSYIALRLVLGSAEAGFFPGVIVYLSRWFSRKRLSYSSWCRERTSVNRAQRAESRTEPPNWGCLRSH